MDTKKNNSLETFVERHRADFDTHEPRPDLWAALEEKLNAATPAPQIPAMRVAEAVEVPFVAPVAAAAPVVQPEARLRWFQRYGVAAALALLVFAAGASEAWKSRSAAPETAVAAAPAASLSATATEPDAALYQGGNPLSLTAAEHTTGADSQLVRAVRGMEAYYTNQLARRQAELSQLSGPGMAAMNADWQHELVSLDSSYRELKQQLLHHPQPDAVLTAMNRNLQIRLDILDRQLNLGNNAQAAPNTSSYVLADSRRQAE
ncbi:hypothetical protein [Hymenobacter negativus]|uniref:Anti-sigma factor n=1 Tax=Hymenobacter negativus TaxID=2795026 RepID=A0ABS0QA10_9BACT|nr:hypothetical protein [Hymenobacter negativus]MBH8559522.1 hypothetical protein [Hymenobacter negativus]